MNGKALLSSSTFWVAVAQAIVAALAVFATAYPGAHWVGIGLMVKSLIDIWLRTQTTQPISGITSAS